MPDASHLFLSFNSRDREKVRHVHRFLTKHGIATFFDEQNLRAGQNWPQALERALGESNAVAVFVGSQIGNWQWPEIGFALDRQANDKQFPVIPVLLDGADTGRSFLFLNTWVDLRERIDDAEALQRLLDAVSHPALTDDDHRPDLNPYRGLEIFDEAHAPFFFGREKFIDDLFARLTERRKKFVAVIGASGSGKSSVVRAGLIPRLRRRRPPHETWDMAVFTPGERPWFRLADALGPLRFPDKSDAELDIEVDKLAAALQSGELRLESLLDRILQRQGKLHRLLVVVDQFEELFTLTPSGERASFIDRLVSSLAVEGVVLLPTLRADFYGQAIEADRRLSDLLGQEQITLGRLTPDELMRAIVEPARLARLTFDPGLPDLLLRDAGNEPGNLPLLQHALLELYTRGAGVRLTMDNYQAIGGIRKAIANSAEREYRRFDELGQGALVRAVFTQLVRLARSDEGLEDTRRRVTISALPSEAERIVDEFASYRYRLLVKANERVSAAPGNGGHEGPLAHETETVEVAHEALIREWDRLKNWLNEDRGFYLWRQRLDLAIKDYDEHGGEAEYLLHGPALKEAEGKLDASMPEPLAPRQRKFIERSLDQRDRAERERREERERQLQEIATQQQARSRLQRIAMWGFGIGSCVLLAIAVGVVVQTRAVARQTPLVLTDAGERADDEKRFDVGLRFGVLAAKESWLSPTHPNAAPQLARAAQSSALQFESRGIVDFSPDGKRIVNSSEDKSARVWDLETGKPVGDVLKHDKRVGFASFSPDGKRVVTAADDNVRVWDVESGKPVGDVLKHDKRVGFASFSPDGKRFVERGKRERDAFKHEGWVRVARFSPDGRRILTVAGGKARVWDVESGKPVGDVVKHEWAVHSASFSPDGKRIVSSEHDSVRVWDVESGRPVGGALKHEALDYTDDGKRIVTLSEDTGARVWDVESGKPVGEVLKHEGKVESAVFSPDGKRVLTVAGDKPRVWDVESGKPVGEVLKHEGWVRVARFSRDGNRVVIVAGDKALVWDVESGKPAGVLKHEGDVHDARFSPDGKRVVSWSDTGARVWDVESVKSVGDVLKNEHDGDYSFGFIHEASGLSAGRWARAPGCGTWRAANRWARCSSTKAKSSPSSSAPTASGSSVWQATRPASGTWRAANRWATCSSTRAGSTPPGSAPTASGSSPWQTTRPGCGTWRAVGKPVGEALKHTIQVKSASFSPDSKRVVTASVDTSARVWDVESGKPVGAVLWNGGTVNSTSFSPDGKLVVIAAGDEALVWDVESGKLAGVLKHEGDVRAASFSPDGKRIVTAAGDEAWVLDAAWSALARSPDLVREVCEKKLVGSARRLRQADVRFAPILAGRVGEDVCTGEITADSSGRGK